MKNNKNALTFIFITLLIDVIGLGIIIPVVPDLLKQITGQEVSEASSINGWLTFAYATMQFVFSPILGCLSDKYGRRPILLLSLLGLGLDYFVQGFAPSLFWLFIGRMIAGFSGASYSTATAYIADISEPEKRAQNFGIVGIAFGVGFIIGPLIGGICGNFWGPRAPFYVAGILSLINLAYGYFVLPESLSVENRRAFEWKRANPFGAFKQLSKYKLVLPLVIAEFFVYLAGKAVESNWTFFVKFKFDWSELTLGLSLAFVGILIAVVQGWLIRIVIPKFGSKKAVIIGLILDTVGLFLFSMASSSWMMFLFLIPYCLGGIAGPALQGVISNQVPADEQGELQGAINSAISITYILGPLMMNNLFYYFTNKNAPIIFPGAPFLLGTIFGLIGLSLAYRAMKGKVVE